MPDVTISVEAAKLIAAKSREPAPASMKNAASIPVLSWARRVTFTDLSGEQTELGPRFFLIWSNTDLM